MSESLRSEGGGDRKRFKAEDVGGDGPGQTGVAMPGSGESPTNDRSVQASPNSKEDDILPGIKPEHGQKVEDAFVAAIKVQEGKSLGDAVITEKAELEKLLEGAEVGSTPYTLNPGVTASMEELYCVCRQPSSFDKFCGKFFQWELSYKTLLNKPSVEDGVLEALEGAAPVMSSQEGTELDNPMKQYPMIPRECRLILSIRGVNTANEPVWIEWLNIRESLNGKARKQWGLFSSRRFAKGEVIGPYCGKVINTWESCQEKELAHQTLAPEKVGASAEGPYVSGKNGILCLVSPWVRENETGPLKLLLGFQYMVRSSSARVGNREPNVEITKNGFVVAARTLKKGAELISPL